MDWDVLLLSRIQFAFTVSFHIIFPSFTIGLAGWLAVLEARWLITGHPYYRQLFDLWLKVFGVSFGMGVVSSIVMAFQFGTNWSVLAERAGPVQGPLLGYEAFTAFLLEATFFGVLLFGRDRAPPWVYFLSCCMVALGTSFSAFWIMVNNSWMQAPVAYELIDGRFVPHDWQSVLFHWVARTRFLHTLLGAWYLLAARSIEPARIMMTAGLGLAAIPIVPQIVLGHFNGIYVHDLQPAKFAAIEARWETEQPASETLIGWPDETEERNLYAITIPRLGSFVASGTWDSREVGLKSFRPEDRPSVYAPLFGFRIMVGMALIMWALSWFGMLQRLRRKEYHDAHSFLWAVALGFPSGFVAIICGWFVAEIGRQPWVVYGLLRTVDAHSPAVTAPQVLTSLTMYVIVYTVIFVSGAYYIVHILRTGPEHVPEQPPPAGLTAKRPMAVPGGSPGGVTHRVSAE